MPGLELGKDRHDVIGAVGADAEMSARERAAAGEQGARLLLGGEQARGHGKQRLAGRRHVHPAPLTVEEADAIARLQATYLGRQGRLTQSGGAGGERKSARLGNEMEGAELGQVHI